MSLFPAIARFETDTTPPTPTIFSPVFGGAVRDSVVILGTADDSRFAGFGLFYRPEGVAGWLPPDAVNLIQSASPVTADTLGAWDTRNLVDGNYDLLLAVSDTLGLIGNAVITVTVDNEEPFVEETTPVRINAAEGGHVFTTHREAHVYFPPGAFSQDVLVTVDPTSDNQVPDTLPSGAVKLSSGYTIGWGAPELQKTSALELSLTGIDPRPGAGQITVYRKRQDGSWAWAGGTASEESEVIALPVDRAGSYAIFDTGSAAPESPSVVLGSLSLTPRVFSPTGGFASRAVAISFVLGRGGETTVKIFNRAGRLVREVTSAMPLTAGANVVRWDGLDSEGAVVEDGLYLVTVEAIGEKLTRTLAVVR